MAHTKISDLNRTNVILSRKIEPDFFREYMQNPIPLYEWQNEMMQNPWEEIKMKPNLKFKITELLSLELIFGKTIVMIDNKEFNTCTYLILNIPVNKTHEYDHIESIDHLIDNIGSERYHTGDKNLPSPRARFWAHCSNFQAWVEHDYDTRLIDSRLSFPILKKLVSLGDVKAKRVYKEELVYRLLEGHNNIFYYARQMGLFSDFTIEELKTLKNDILEKEGFKNNQNKIDNFDAYIKFRIRLVREEIERKKEQNRLKRRQDRLEKMWSLQEEAVQAMERLKQQTLLYWVYKIGEDPKPYFTRAYREKRWLEQMLYRHSVREIAKRCQVNPTTIYYWTKKHRISVKGIKTAKMLNRNRYKKKKYYN